MINLNMKINIEKSLYKSFYFLVFFSGVIVGTFNSIGFPLTTNYISMISFFLLIIIVLIGLVKKPLQKYELYILMFFLLILFGIIFKITYYLSDISVSTLSVVIPFYFIPFLTFFSMRNIYNNREIFDFLKKMGFILVVFGLVQAFFPSFLSESFRYVPSSAGDYIGHVNLEGYIFNPPNGLVGNAMMFGTFLVLIYIIHLPLFFTSKLFIDKVKVILILILIFLLFSRAAFVGSFFIFFMFIFFYTSKTKFIIYSSIFLIVFLLILSMMYGENHSVTYMIDRVLGTNENAIASTQAHIGDYIKVFEAIAKNPIFGYPISSLSNDIITDGTWFRMLLDMGILVFSIYLLLWIYFLYIIYIAYIKLQDKEISIIAFCMYTYITLANFLNSSYLAKINSILFMFIIGALYYKLNNLNKEKK